jgi:hypothetical protein
MAGISVTLEGSNIQLSFRKGDQATAVVMDPRAARSLVRALGQLLEAISGDGDEPEGVEGEDAVETASSIEIGLDEGGQPVLMLQAGPASPVLVRLKDDEARHIAQSLLEILNAPRDVRTSQGGH